MNSFAVKVRETTGRDLCADSIDRLQVNLGWQCNQQCRHCHVSASPDRSECMSPGTLEAVIGAVRRLGVSAIDITGGAPELHEGFRHLVTECRRMGCEVSVRTNLTVFFEPGQEGAPEFLRDAGARVIASMPCYLQENVDAQRGGGVYDKSVAALRRLNDLGYGRQADLVLDLVYNPVGPALPPDQQGLEADYHRQLTDRWGVEFTHLLTIANMPLGRFAERLRREGGLEEYEAMLGSNFNADTLQGLMCRRQLSVRWDGAVFDCDFNQVLDLPPTDRAAGDIRSVDAAVAQRRIRTGPHCFGCTAGQGSSCDGRLVANAEPAGKA
ncbi:MAG: radical SAM/Cys-rich domain protein [Anaerolineaceae bacterium]|nr:radical SAM/Cys-rich domain protein [Anaerolineaceae bacterium]